MGNNLKNNFSGINYERFHELGRQTLPFLSPFRGKIIILYLCLSVKIFYFQSYMQKLNID